MRAFFYVSNCQDLPPRKWRTLRLKMFLKWQPGIDFREQNEVHRKNFIVENRISLNIKSSVGEQLIPEREQLEIENNTVIIKYHC